MSETLKHYGVLGMKWGVRKSKGYLRSEADRLSKRSKSKIGTQQQESYKSLRNTYLRPIKTGSAKHKIRNNAVDSLRAKSIRSKVSRKKSQLTKDKIKKELTKAKMLEKRAKSENAGLFKEYGRGLANSFLRPIDSIKGPNQVFNQRTYKLEAAQLRGKAKTTKDRNKAKRMLEKAKEFDRLAKTAKNDNAVKAYGKQIGNLIKRPNTTTTAKNKLINDEVDRTRVQKLRKQLEKDTTARQRSSSKKSGPTETVHVLKLEDLIDEKMIADSKRSIKKDTTARQRSSSKKSGPTETVHVLKLEDLIDEKMIADSKRSIKKRKK